MAELWEEMEGERRQLAAKLNVARNEQQRRESDLRALRNRMNWRGVLTATATLRQYEDRALRARAEVERLEREMASFWERWALLIRLESAA